MKLHCCLSAALDKARGSTNFLLLMIFPCFIYHQSLGLNFPKLFINNKLATFLFLFISTFFTNKKYAKEKRNTFNVIL